MANWLYYIPFFWSVNRIHIVYAMVKLFRNDTDWMDTMKKTLVLGASGMLGHQLCRQLSNRLDLWGTVQRHPQDYLRYGLLPDDHLIGNIDAFKIEKVAAVLDRVQPEAVINAIGIVKQRDEARQAIPSIQINALFPHLLAEACIERQIRLIHISTDCVFSGAAGGYTESDIPDPVDLYGRSKLLGELHQPGCLTLRTSIVGWELFGRSSLLEWFAAQRSRTIKGYQRAIFTGFPSSVLANLIGDIVATRSDLSGLYHVASSPISKYDLLLRLRDALGWEDIVINPETQFHCDRSLLATRFERMTGWQPPDWEEMIAVLAQEWLTYQNWRASNP